MIWFPWLRDKDRLKCEGISMNKDIAFYEYHDSLFIAKGPEHGSLCTESRSASIEAGMCKMWHESKLYFLNSREECWWVEDKFCEYFAASQSSGID